MRGPTSQISGSDWMSLRPNLQYVVAPGAVSEVKDAFIGGISANIAF